MRPQQVLPKGASWVKTTIKNIPKNAFVGGWEDGGKRKVYIGRAAHPDSLICGKVIQFWGGMFFPLLGKEVKNDNFEILVADNPNVFKWVKSSGALMKTTNIPENAVHGGYQGSETLYVARGINPAKEPTPGKLHPPWGFFLSWGGKEHHKPDFEVLVCDSATETSTAAQQPSKAKKPVVGPDTISIASSAPSGPEPVYWVATKDANIPKNAVFSNKGGNGDFYIGRAKHKGSWIPGKVAPHRKKMYYPLDGKEHSTSIYEILVTDTPSVIQWIAASGAGVPKDAFVGGYFGKQPLYVARAKGPDGFLHPGRLQLSQGFFLSLNGKEHKVNNYEVFVISGYLDSDMSNSMSNLSVDVPSETSEELAGDAPCEDLTVDVPCV